MILLEVIACSVADAIEAEAGGAGRIELIRDLDIGGMTPPLRLVKDVVAAVRIPVRAMIRETIDFQVDAPETRAHLHQAARDFSGCSLDGVVLGFLYDGAVDLSLTRSVLEAGAGLKATFHHAFEAATDPFAAIEALKQIPEVDRILTYGGQGDWTEKSARLREYQSAADGITILAGGGITEETGAFLAASTNLNEFHAGRAVRVPAESSGNVSRDRVRSLLNRLTEARSKP